MSDWVNQVEMKLFREIQINTISNYVFLNYLNAH